jgi:hypothetical protein
MTVAKWFPRFGFEGFRDCNQVRFGVVVEDGLHVIIVPAIEVLGQGKVGVASEEDVLVSSVSTLLDRHIEAESRSPMTVPVAIPVGVTEGSARFASVMSIG